MRLTRIFATALLLGAASIALAEPIKLIVPTPPGGGTDGFFRVLAKEAAPFIKDPIVVINVPGAGGTIGVAQMVHSAPDGQTLAAVWLGPVTVAPHTMKVQYTAERLRSGDPAHQRAVRALRASGFSRDRR